MRIACMANTRTGLRLISRCDPTTGRNAHIAVDSLTNIKAVFSPSESRPTHAETIISGIEVPQIKVEAD